MECGMVQVRFRYTRLLRIFQDCTSLTGRLLDLRIETAIPESSFIGGWDFNATSEKEECMQLA